MKIINLEQNSTEWLEWRKSGFSASEAPSVMGVSKYFPHTPFELYQVHTGQKEVVYTKAMADGHKYEQTALDMINANGFNYQPTCATNGEFIASLDGYDPEINKVVEIKTTKENSDLWVNGETIYKWQLVHQAIVAGVDEVLLFIYAKDTGAAKTCLVPIKESEKETLKAAWLKFGEAMDSFTAPALTEKDYRENESSEWKELADEYNALKRTQAGIDQRLKELKAELVEMADKAPTRGAGVIVYPVTRKGNVNYKKVPELEGVDLEQYRGKGSSYWAVK